MIQYSSAATIKCKNVYTKQEMKGHTASTHDGHLLDDNLTDLFGCGYLRLLTQHSTNQRAHNKLNTFARVNGIDVRLCCLRVGDESEDVVEYFGHVSFQPHAAHALAQLYIRLLRNHKRFQSDLE